ncbi:MAG: UDP-glucose:(heptosyl)LPS alpha-1,3-glucosyltransferase, partial [Candidatus Azotimanducaceae bacterium]
MASVAAANSRSACPTPVGGKTLKLAFCLYKYFPHGGLQRDFLRIALECQSLGHDIRVFTLSWQGPIPDGFSVTIVPVTAITNHTRYERFSEWVKLKLKQEPADSVIGINKMPGLDVYYAADSCYEEKAQTQRGLIYRLLPRYRHFSEYERAVFGQDSATEILMISEVQKPFFERYYGTQPERVQFLPPGISKDRIAPMDVMEQRAKKRSALGVLQDEKLLLMIGSGFVKKGLNRALRALRSLPKARRRRVKFVVIGEDNPKPFRRLSRFLGISKQVTILSGQDDVPAFLFAADLLVLPSLDEAAGIVLLEAVVAGLPVLTTENCGYAHYVQEAGMGELVRTPYQQSELNEKLDDMLHDDMLHDDNRERWIERGRSFAQTADIYSLHRHAAKKIEAVAFERARDAEADVVACCLFKYFPFGGLQRDFIRIAQGVQARGARIRVYTLDWQGDVPAGFEIIIVPVSSVTNHSRYRQFYEWVQSDLNDSPVARVVGFNKMPGLDIYYAADSCYEDKARTQRSALYRLLPRYRLFSEFEEAVFGEGSKTEILMISPVQVPLFKKYYGTQSERIHMLAPGIALDRIAPPNRSEVRRSFRKEMALGDDVLLLLIGSGFVTKGLDRALIGLAALPEKLQSRVHLYVIGQDAPGAFRRMATRLGVQEQVTFMKGRD